MSVGILLSGESSVYKCSDDAVLAMSLVLGLLDAAMTQEGGVSGPAVIFGFYL